MKVTFYETLAGRRPVEEYIQELPTDRRDEVTSALLDLSKHGHDDAEVNMRHISGKLWEVKFSTDRIFYVVVIGAEMILLHACKKQSQRAPPREIETAMKRMRIVLENLE